MTTTAVAKTNPEALAEIHPGAAQFYSDLQEFRPQFEAALGDRFDPDHFIQLSLTAFLDPKNKLAECEPASIVRALFKCAQLKLRPDGKQCAVIPRGRVADAEPMVRGVLVKMLRTGTVKKVESRVVKSGDAFAYEYGLDPKLVHVPKEPSYERGGTTYAYAIVWLTNGETQFEVIDREELDAIKRRTKENNKGKLGPAWSEYEDEMFRKIVVKRLSKYVEDDDELAAVLAADDAIMAGRSYDPRDYLPELEDRSLEERAREHADRQTAELRDAVDRSAGNGEVAEPGEDESSAPEVGTKSILDRTVGFGKHKGSTWREVYETKRGYITRWALSDQVDALSDEEKEELRVAVEALDAEREAEDEESNAEPDPPDESSATEPEPETSDAKPEDESSATETSASLISEAYSMALRKATSLSQVGKLPKGTLSKIDALAKENDFDGLVALDAELGKLLGDSSRPTED